MTTERIIKPYRSLVRALKRVPKTIQGDKVYKVQISAGEYTDFPDFLDIAIGDGGLVLEGIGDPEIVDAGPYTVDSVTAIGTAQVANTIAFAGTPFTANEFHGYFLQVVTGDGEGEVYPIFKNTTSAIIVGVNSAVKPIAATDTIRIVKPAVTITVDHPVGLNFRSLFPKENGSYASPARVVFANIGFVFSGDGDYSTKLCVRGDVFLNTFLTSIKLKEDDDIVQFDEVSVNTAQNAYDDMLENETFNDCAPSILINPKNGTLPTSEKTNVYISNAANVGYLAMRGKISSGSPMGYSKTGGSLAYSQTGRVYHQGSSFLDMLNYKECISATDDAYDVGPGGILAAFYGYVAKARNAFIQIGGEIQASLIEISATGVTGYGIKCSNQSKFCNQDNSCALVGATGEIYFTDKASSNAVSLPAQGAIATDSLGSVVLNSRV